MKNRYLYSFCFLFSTLAIEGFSQQSDMNLRLEIGNLLEDYFFEDETKDVEQLVNDLQIILEHPLHVNRAGENELAALRFLDPVQIKALLSYREKFGNILSEYELASIPGFDEKLARLTGYFVVFDRERSQPRKSAVRQEVLTRMVRLAEKQAGFKDPKKYEGSPQHLYFRYQYTSGSLRAGFTGEKDGGESFFRASNENGFDFYSGFVQIKSGNEKWQAVLGDYVVQFGQGLTAWQGFSLGKSAESTRVGNFSQGFRPYTSSDENNFLRGTAFGLTTGRFRFTSFVSLKNFDANISQSDGGPVFTSFQTSGYHRTTGEIEDEKSVSSFTAGGNIRYEGKQISLGMTAIQVSYEYPLVREEEEYSRFLFEGKRVTNWSADYRYGMNKLYVFGELATNLKRGFASTTGLMYQPVDKIELSSVFRMIGRRYSSPLASSFSEGSQVNDENGLYVGARVLPLPRVSMNMYMDFFRFNHIKYTTASAGNGREFMFQVNYMPGKKWEIYGRYFYECKPVKVSGVYSKKNVDQLRQSVRLNMTGEVTPWLAVKTRFEQTFFRHDHYSTGFLLSQDVGIHPEKLPANFWWRIAYFKTGDYDSRIYCYENDLLYQFSVPPLYGEGMRAYLTGKVKICEKVEFWYKLSRTWFSNVESISSGNSLILGNKRTELKFQIRFRI